MGVRITVQLVNNLPKITPAILASTAHGVTIAGERLLALSADLVPLDNGDLLRSGSVSTPLSSRGGDPEVQVVYDTKYAARLHEHPEYNFSTDSNPNAQGKYLENAALDNREELAEIIVEQIRRSAT